MSHLRPLKAFESHITTTYDARATNITPVMPTITLLPPWSTSKVASSRPTHTMATQPGTIPMERVPLTHDILHRLRATAVRIRR